MRTVTQRDLLDNGAEILRAVSGGETIEVTNHGEVVAVLVPPGRTVYERLVAEGKVRELPPGRPGDLRAIPRMEAPLSSDEINADIKGDRN